MCFMKDKWSSTQFKKQNKAKQAFAWAMKSCYPPAYGDQAGSNTDPAPRRRPGGTHLAAGSRAAAAADAGCSGRPGCSRRWRTSCCWSRCRGRRSGCLAGPAWRGRGTWRQGGRQGGRRASHGADWQAPHRIHIPQGDKYFGLLNSVTNAPN